MCDSLRTFTEALTRIFQHVSPGNEAAEALLKIRQGKRTVADYTVKFRSLCIDSGWNMSALVDAFIHCLSSVKAQLICRSSDLDALITIIMKIDKRIRKRETEQVKWRSDNREHLTNDSVSSENSKTSIYSQSDL